MVQRALSSGVEASYVLMDSWFTQQPLIQSLVEQGIDVIGMVKATNQRYIVVDKRGSLKELYHLATPTSGKKASWLYPYNDGKLRSRENSVRTKP